MPLLLKIYGRVSNPPVSQIIEQIITETMQSMVVAVQNVPVGLGESDLNRPRIGRYRITLLGQLVAEIEMRRKSKRGAEILELLVSQYYPPHHEIELAGYTEEVQDYIGPLIQKIAKDSYGALPDVSRPSRPNGWPSFGLETPPSGPPRPWIVEKYDLESDETIGVVALHHKDEEGYIWPSGDRRHIESWTGVEWALMWEHGKYPEIYKDLTDPLPPIEPNPVLFIPEQEHIKEPVRTDLTSKAKKARKVRSDKLTPADYRARAAQFKKLHAQFKDTLTDSAIALDKMHLSLSTVRRAVNWVKTHDMQDK